MVGTLQNQNSSIQKVKYNAKQYLFRNESSTSKILNNIRCSSPNLLSQPLLINILNDGERINYNFNEREYRHFVRGLFYGKRPFKVRGVTNFIEDDSLISANLNRIADYNHCIYHQNTETNYSTRNDLNFVKVNEGTPSPIYYESNDILNENFIIKDKSTSINNNLSEFISYNLYPELLNDKENR